MKRTLVSILAPLLIAPALSVHAAGTAVDCSKKTLAGEIAKLDKSAPNILNISGNCAEDIVVSGFQDLTLIGVGGASITATGPTGTGTALLVNERSRITVQTLTLNGGYDSGVSCTGRSSCVFRNVTIQGGGNNGIGVQDQSGADILGSSVIRNSLGNGIGVFGASTVNVRPDPWTGEEAGPVISGHPGVGAWVQDGSFLRTDNSTFSGNGTGIVAQRNAVIKIYSEDSQSSIGGVINNVGDGIIAKWSATASVSGPISGNGGAGVKLGALTFFQDIGALFSNNGQNIVCQHPTAISVPFSYCGH